MHSASVMCLGTAKKIWSMDPDLSCIGGTTVTNSVDDDEATVVWPAKEDDDSSSAL